jgi:hypothetical protein
MTNPAENISQKERREILANDRKVRSTYLDHGRMTSFKHWLAKAKVTNDPEGDLISDMQAPKTV